MSLYLRTLLQSFVKPFYKENAGSFIFLFTVMFGIVNKVDGADLFAYHLSLATGILQSPVFMVLVFAGGFIYCRKAVLFVSTIIKKTEFVFLQVYNQLSVAVRFRLLLTAELLLMLPVLLYVCFIIFTGIQLHIILPVIISIVYVLCLCLSAAVLHLYQLNFLRKKNRIFFRKAYLAFPAPSTYVFILSKFVFRKQLPLWLGIKIFTCGILYLIVRQNTDVSNEISMVFLLFTFGIFSNAILIFRIRNFEETQLCFIRSLPVKKSWRLLQYFGLYTLCFIPEIATAGSFLPAQLAASLLLSGIGLILLMHTITYLEDFKMINYIKVLLCIFCLESMLVVLTGFTPICIMLFGFTGIIFYRHYYRFEKK